MTILGYLVITLLATGVFLLVHEVRKGNKHREYLERVRLFEKNYPDTFISIDTETATKNNDVCQLAYAVVENGEIVVSKAYLVKPVGNRYQKSYTNIHGMDSATTEKSPGIAEVWPEFEDLIKRYGFVAAHNAEFHINAILESLKRDGWKSEALYNAEIVDTAELTRSPLRYCVEEYNLGIDFKQDALCHATACAKLLIRLRELRNPL